MAFRSFVNPSAALFTYYTCSSSRAKTADWITADLMGLFFNAFRVCVLVNIANGWYYVQQGRTMGFPVSLPMLMKHQKGDWISWGNRSCRNDIVSFPPSECFQKWTPITGTTTYIARDPHKQLQPTAFEWTLIFFFFFQFTIKSMRQICISLTSSMVFYEKKI